MGRAITIRTDLGTATDLRRMAKQQGVRRTTLRLLAIANALDGMSRAQAARSAGIERQSLCDAIQRFNAEGIAGLIDRPKGHRGQRLSEAEQAVLINRILRGPDPDQGEPCARAVQMVFDHQGEHASQSAPISSIAVKIGCAPETLRHWVRQTERDQGRRAGPTTAEHERIRALEREVRQANEILRKASAYFAMAALDRRSKP